MTENTKEKPEQFKFSLANNPDGELVAIVSPLNSSEPEDSKLSYDIVRKALPSAEYVDDCVIGYWTLPPEADTPEKVAMILIGCGFIFDREGSDAAYRDAVPQPPPRPGKSSPKPGV